METLDLIEFCETNSSEFDLDLEELTWIKEEEDDREIF